MENIKAVLEDVILYFEANNYSNATNDLLNRSKEVIKNIII